MDEELIEALNKATLRDLKDVQGQLTVGSEEYLNAMKSINQTCEILNEAKKVKEESLSQELDREVEREKIDKDIQAGNKELIGDLIESGVRVGETVLKSAFTAAIVVTLLKFEETGVLRSKTWSWVPKLLK